MNNQKSLKDNTVDDKKWKIIIKKKNSPQLLNILSATYKSYLKASFDSINEVFVALIGTILVHLFQIRWKPKSAKSGE